MSTKSQATTGPSITNAGAANLGLPAIAEQGEPEHDVSRTTDSKSTSIAENALDSSLPESTGFVASAESNAKPTGIAMQSKVPVPVPVPFLPCAAPTVDQFGFEGVNDVMDFAPDETGCDDDSDSDTVTSSVPPKPKAKPATTKKTNPSPAALPLNDRDYLSAMGQDIHFQVLAEPGIKDAACLNLRILAMEYQELSVVRERCLDKMGIARKDHGQAKLGYKLGGWAGGKVTVLESQEDWDYVRDQLGAHLRLVRKDLEANKSRSRKSKEPVCISITNVVSTCQF